LPPIENGCKFDPLDTASNCKSQKKTIKVRFHGAPGHLELSRNLGIVATLQQQFGDLLFARTQPNGALVHFGFPLRFFTIQARFGQLLIEVARARAPCGSPESLLTSSYFGFLPKFKQAVPGVACGVRITPYFQIFWVSPKIHSMHNAKPAVDFLFPRKKSRFLLRPPGAREIRELTRMTLASRLFSSS
jgi:hypothetical protein